jgi:ABC-type multidrug transport system ATPase subunit
MDKGHIIAQGTPNDLKNNYSSDYLIVYRKESKELNKALKDKGYKFNYNEEKHIYNIVIKDTSEAKKLLIDFDNELPDVEIRKGTMDDVFLNVTGEGEMINEK